MALNNELAAARGEAGAAEENVLWQLTGQVIDNLEDIQRALDNVRALEPFQRQQIVQQILQLLKYGYFKLLCFPSANPLSRS